MNIQLYVNNDEKNKINKTLSAVGNALNGSIKERSSVTDPIILIEYTDPTSFNYAYIEEFDRYYFVTDVVVVGHNLIELRLSIDVLMSYRTQILSQNVIIDRNTNEYDPYLQDPNLITKVKTRTDIVNFSGGLLDNGEFILITAG